MRVSEQWLREWVATSLDVSALAQKLTLAGLEVGGIAPAAPDFNAVVIGKVIESSPHPQADQLRVCKVSVGANKPVLNIVCGATNVAVGVRAPVALVGAQLAGREPLAASAIRGVMSEGMLCSAADLGLEDASDGLLLLASDAKVGAPVARYLALPDRVLEVELTPNRGDCLSIRGLARELAAITGAKFVPVKVRAPRANVKIKRVPLHIAAKNECPHYVGQAVMGIDPHARTPIWLRERLRRSGVRSIHPAVDVTNYVMLELGQPMHAFDLDRVQGVQVRRARAGEALVLLDERELSLQPDDLVIADNTRVLALAGVMGGRDAGVNAQTGNIFFESAYFHPQAVSRQARKYGLHTESSHRFERGVDPHLQAEAVARAVALLQTIAGGDAGPVQEFSHRAALPKSSAIKLRRTRLRTVLGTDIPAVEVLRTFKALGMRASASAAAWTVTPPSYRFDIGRECDLIEEVARIRGYERLPHRLPRMAMAAASAPTAPQFSQERARDVLVARGYQEAITYSFVDPAIQALVDPDTTPLALMRPLASDMSVMRTTLWAGLLPIVGYNLRRQQERVRIFEIGSTFKTAGAGKLDQRIRLAGAAAGELWPVQWGVTPRAVDLFDIKADVEALLALAGHKVAFRSGGHPALHPGQCAEICRGNDVVGFIGRLHPRVAADLALPPAVIVFELDFAAICSKNLVSFREVSRFPQIRRDLSLVIEAVVPAQTVLSAIRQVASDWLVALDVVSDFRGEGIDSGRKSLSVALTLQDSSRTLKEEAVEQVITKVIAALQKQFGAHLRQ